MRNGLRAVFAAIVGKVLGKTGRPDTATRMAADADFSGRGESTPPRAWWHERDDGRLFKSADPLADIDLLQELIRIVNEAQERDGEDERRLYGPPIPKGLSFQRRPRPDRR